MSNYRSRTGETIDEARWEMLHQSAAYSTVREFQNHAWRVKVQWIGVESMTFRLLITNMVTNASGKSVERSSGFEAEEGAINAYEDFLVANTNCEWVPSSTGPGGMRLLEVGNELTAAPTQDTETAKRAVIELEQGLAATPDYGSW